MKAHPAELQSLRIGDIEITYLPDGVHHVEGPTHYPAWPASVFEEHPEVIDDDGWLVMSLGGVLVRTPEVTVLVDVGAGQVSQSMSELTQGQFNGDLIGGGLLDSLAKVGLGPADIDAVVITHMHNDHIGWVCSPSGGATFPRARFWINAREWAYWSHPDQVGSVAGAKPDQIAVLAASLEAFDGHVTVAAGIETFPTPGHTPGHTSVLITAGEQSALVLGDSFHCPVELHHPGMVFVFDQDAELASTSRRRIEERLRQPGTWFVGGHFPTTVFGRLLDGPAGPRLELDGP